MTKQSDLIGTPNYTLLLDHGFVGLVDHMGSDDAIVHAARLSYGSGTKAVRDGRGLIRYLVRHKHTSPLEMCEIKLHLKLPIFVMRQLVRHRTSSLNEYSGRYSEMTDEFYIPDLADIQPQSKTNKQGRAGTLDPSHAASARDLITRASEDAYDIYQLLLGSETHEDLSEDFPGIAREMARIVLPVNNYTELVWKQNLHNMLHLLKLRADSHAQKEIRVYAEAIYAIIKPLFPLAVEAWEDYVRDATSLSRMDKSLIGYLLRADKTAAEAFADLLEDHNSFENVAAHFGMSTRELTELTLTFGIPH